MRATFAKSPSETSTIFPNLRFVLGDLDERMWRVFVWPRLILPVPVFLKRFFAPVWVFNLGIFFSILAIAVAIAANLGHQTGNSLPRTASVSIQQDRFRALSRGQ